MFKGRPRKNKGVENVTRRYVKKPRPFKYKKKKVQGPPPSVFKSSDSSNKSSPETTIKKKVVTQDKNPTDPETFKKELYAFMEKRGTPIIKIPSIGYAKVDVHQLFELVAAYGGYGQVTLKRQWRSVYDQFGHSTSITNSATCTRKAYEKLLLPYEKYLRNKDSQGIKNNAKTKTIHMETNSKNTNRGTVISSHDEMESEQSTKAVINNNTTNISVEEAGDAFRLMIQKRRGRPSKEFREKIEKLKNMKKKVEVEIYPPLNKYSKIPAWLNELNVDIVNSQRKRKRTPVKESNLKEIKKINLLPKPLKHIKPKPVIPSSRIPDYGSISHVPLSGTRQYETPVYKFSNPDVNVAIVNNKPITSSQSTSDICEFEIQSVRSLAHEHVQTKDTGAVQYIHFPSNSNNPPSSTPTIAVPHSVLSYHDFFSSKTQNKIDQQKEVTVVASHYPVNRTFRDAQFAVQSFGQSADSNTLGSLHSYANGRDIYRRISPAASHLSTRDVTHPAHIYRSPPREKRAIYDLPGSGKRKSSYPRYKVRISESDNVNHDDRISSRYNDQEYIIHQPHALHSPYNEVVYQTERSHHHPAEGRHSFDRVTDDRTLVDRPSKSKIVI